mmetsp:Transcript_3056/g.9334  ORF Transcript_3056/g.9334 Transcript_3056/m.9334 type:complete len:168 (+) Transcript_3056:105-608(+)
MPRGRRDLSGKGRHACMHEGCGKRFHRSYNLKVHQRVHTGDRPYVCTYPLCERKFAWKASLDSHKLSHNKARCESPPKLADQSDDRQARATTSSCTAPCSDGGNEYLSSVLAGEAFFEVLYVQDLDDLIGATADGMQEYRESRDALQETGVISFGNSAGQTVWHSSL